MGANTPPNEETVLEYIVRQRLTQRQLTDMLKFLGERPQGSQSEMAEQLLSQKALKMKDVLDRLSEQDLKTIIRRFEIPEPPRPSGATGFLMSALGDSRNKLTKQIEDFAANQRKPTPRGMPTAAAPPAPSPPPAAPVQASAPVHGGPPPARTEAARPVAAASPAPAIVGVADQTQFESLCRFLESYTFTKRWTDEASYEAELGGAISGHFPGQKVVHQMAVGGTRADLVALGAVIEIKYPKNRQPLQTLIGQVEDYQKLFANRVVVVLCAGGWPDATQAFNDSAASLTDRGARVFIK